MEWSKTMTNYTIIRSDDHLAHYGIPGMKWGRRKARPVSKGRTSYRKMNKDYRSSIRSNYKASRQGSANRTQAFYKASRASQKEMISKYGKESYDNLNKHNAKMAKARAATYLAAAGLLAATASMKTVTTTGYLR